MILGRKKIALHNDLLGIKKDKKYIWFHAASVGEYEQALPLIELFASKEKYEIAVSFFSSSGYAYAKNRYPEFVIFYLPFDRKKSIENIINIIRPVAVIVVKYEFWYYFLHCIYLRKIPLFLISSHFRKNQIFFKKWGVLHRKMLDFFSTIFVQSKESEILLHGIKKYNIKISGDSRWDRVNSIAKEHFYDKKIENFIGDRKVFIAGSIWESDLAILEKIYKILPSHFCIICVPHEPAHFNMNNLNFPILKYSTYTFNHLKNEVLWIDSIGMLSRMYRYAHCAYIGGGFGKGIHNITEAVIYQVPVLIGPHFKKYREAVMLTQEKIAFEINTKNVEEILKKHILDNKIYIEIKNKVSAVIAENTNQTEKMSVLIQNEILKEK